MKTILIDVGHGEDTKGKRSPDMRYGFMEWLQVRRIVANLINNYSDEYDFICPLLVCRKDIGLLKRVKMYNAIDCDLFISLHTNASPKKGWSKANGTISFYRRNRDAKIAKAFTKEYAGENSMRLRGTKKNGRFTILRTKHPGFLCEMGFHTNKDDCDKLTDLEKTSDAIKSGIDAVFL